MNWRDLMQRGNLALGLISLVLALWGGMHLQHLLDDAGGRHAGETVVMLVLALLAFAACRYGAGIGKSRA
jgi:predicted membrane-bound spermidine synthase